MRNHFTIRLLALLVTAVLIAAACGGDDDDTTAAVDPIPTAAPTTAPEPTEIPVPTPLPEDFDNTDVTVKPVIVVPDTAPPADLVSEDVVVGSGPEVAAGDFLIMQYVGVSYSSGAQFDASWDRGEPFRFTLGEGSVIQGWDEGIVGMATGGRRTLTIPPDQAYGEAGSGSGAIGPNETLIFTVDLVGVIPAELEKPEVVVPDEPATALVLNDLIEGTGDEAVADTIVTVHYVGVSQSTGEQFDASWDRGIDQMIAFVLGQGQVIEGWDEGLVGMRVGGRREIIIPADLAYGEAGAGGGVIAPNETLVFVVDLIAVS
jgi:FKBP-type peptidyl-prolyl cis-trans isomerase